MDYNYCRYATSKGERKLERALEILPGALSWSVLLGISILSIIEPLIAASIMIAFLLYWLLRIIYMNIFLVISYARLMIEKDTRWMERVQDLDRLEPNLQHLCELNKKKRLSDAISARIHCSRIRGIRNASQTCPKSTDLYHLVIIPVIREVREVVEPGIKAIAEGDFPAKRILLMVALEQSAQDDVKKGIYELQEKYRKDFLGFIISEHPNNLPGEARVKGANATYAATKAAQFFEEHNISYDNVLVSCFDADGVPSRNYFSCLTYHFMVTPHRLMTSYQPIPVYHNNIWDAPAFARIIDIGTSFFQLIEATNPRKMVTFSSHSMSFKALTEVGYWPLDMVSDDSAIFWKAFIHYDGKYRVVPIYTTVSMDIAVGKSIKKTFINIYKQKRRWAWGVENFPIVIRAFLKSKSIPFFMRVSYGYKLLDSFISWATWPFLIALGSWLPVLFASREFVSSTVFYTVPRIQGTIFGLASFGVIICMVLSLLLLPRAKTKFNVIVKLVHVFEWLLIPGIILMLSAVPALDAQTRLMLGKYMEFWVSEKYRSKNGP